MCFNPRARTGRDVHCHRHDTLHLVFQSTRPYGARRSLSSARHTAPGVSIHAPVRGATNSGTVRTGAWWFQSTRPYGARRTVEP